MQGLYIDARVEVAILFALFFLLPFLSWLLLVVAPCARNGHAARLVYVGVSLNYSCKCGCKRFKQPVGD